MNAIIEQKTKILIGCDIDCMGLAWCALIEEDGSKLAAGFLARTYKGQSGMEYEDYPERLAKFVQTCAVHKASLVVEDIYYHKNMKVFRALAGVHAELRYEIWQQGVNRDIAVEYVKASIWQNDLATYYNVDMPRKNGATKVMAREVAETYIKHGEYPSQHAIDAACIAHWKWLCLRNEIEV